MYEMYLKKQPIDELYAKLQMHIFTTHWYMNEYKRELDEHGRIVHKVDEYVQDHSIDEGIKCLERVNMIVDELRIRREIE